MNSVGCDKKILKTMTNTHNLYARTGSGLGDPGKLEQAANLLEAQAAQVQNVPPAALDALKTGGAGQLPAGHTAPANRNGAPAAGPGNAVGEAMVIDAVMPGVGTGMQAVVESAVALSAVIQDLRTPGQSPFSAARSGTDKKNGSSKPADTGRSAAPAPRSSGSRPFQARKGLIQVRDAQPQRSMAQTRQGLSAKGGSEDFLARMGMSQLSLTDESIRVPTNLTQVKPVIQLTQDISMLRRQAFALRNRVYSPGGEGAYHSEFGGEVFGSQFQRHQTLKMQPRGPTNIH